MDKITEYLETYSVTMSLMNNNYVIDRYKVNNFGFCVLNMTRDIRFPNQQVSFLDIMFVENYYVDITLDIKQDKKKIKIVDEFFEKNRKLSWSCLSLEHDKKYKLNFQTENDTLDFLKLYILN